MLGFPLPLIGIGGGRTSGRSFLIQPDPLPQVEAIVKSAARLNDALGDRIKPVAIVLKSADEMPERSDGGPSFGFWKQARREVWLWDETDDYPDPKTLAHEAMHVLDHDFLTRTQRLEIIALMSPPATSWIRSWSQGKLADIQAFLRTRSASAQVYADRAV